MRNEGYEKEEQEKDKVSKFGSSRTEKWMIKRKRKEKLSFKRGVEEKHREVGGEKEEDENVISKDETNITRVC